jgi:menaquinone-dependent protoporphyrinogen oxidase
MNVLVAYASRHGATRGIAERIAAALQAAGIAAEAKPVKQAHDIDDYDAFVIGSAAYMFHWLKEAAMFVRRNKDIISARPVWLFSSGPLGTDLVDKEGRDVMETSRPKEFDELEKLIAPRGEKIFFGAWDPTSPAVGMAERFMRLMPKARQAMPTGDFRDWDAIDGWGAEIAAQLGTIEPTQT